MCLIHSRRLMLVALFATVICVAVLRLATVLDHSSGGVDFLPEPGELSLSYAWTLEAHFAGLNMLGFGTADAIAAFLLAPFVLLPAVGERNPTAAGVAETPAFSCTAELLSQSIKAHAPPRS